ncbi:MAG: glycosyltransferase [Clostridiaceae bacterium]|nr:glycosyltransferase [Clostridiaceae bacterium]
MIVKDEEDLLANCIKSAAGIVNEIIIVDTGSGDSTKDIAKSFGAIVFDYQWDNSFANARNFAISKATYEWLLLLDADEELFLEDLKTLVEFTKSTKYDGAHFKVYNFVGEKDSGEYTLHNALRLVRNCGLYKFTGDIHEQIARVDGKPIEDKFTILNVRLKHYGYLDEVVKKKGKRARNLPILLKELEKEPDNPFKLFNLGNEYMALAQYEKALECYNKSKNHYSKTEAFAPHLLFRRAMCYYTLKMFDLAVKACDEGLEVFPKCTDLLYLKGLIYMEYHRYTLALDAFEAALKLGDPHPALKFTDGCGTYRPYISMGQIYEKLFDYNRALLCYNKALAANNSLYSVLYSIVNIFDKQKLADDEIEKKITSFFSDLSHVPNRIMVSDLFLSIQRLGLSKKHIDLIKYEGSIQLDYFFLLGKYCFYKKDFNNAKAYLENAISCNTGPKVFQNAKGEACSLLFLAGLILNQDNFNSLAGTIEKISPYLKKEETLLLRQVLAVVSGSNENFIEKENPKILLNLFSKYLLCLLKVCEFDLFEKVLYVYNYIESKYVLISLAKVYKEARLYPLAAGAVARSIKELDVLDFYAADLLLDSFLSLDRIPAVKT